MNVILLMLPISGTGSCLEVLVALNEVRGLSGKYPAILKISRALLVALM